MKAEEYNGYKVGALKRKFKAGTADFEPGTFIKLANAQKTAKNKEIPGSTETKVAIMGLV